jgi:hypothetical protein
VSATKPFGEFSRKLMEGLSICGIVELSICGIVELSIWGVVELSICGIVEIAKNF